MNAIVYDKYELSFKEKRDCVIASYIILFVVAYIFYQSVAVSVLAGAFIPLCVKYYAESMRVKRVELLIAQFRDFLYSLSASFSAGRDMRDGLAEAKVNLMLTYDENTPMIHEISDMLNKIDKSRAPVEAVLKDFALRSSVSDIENFVDSYLICRVTGGDTNRVISKASLMLIEKIGIEKEIRALTSQKRFEGKLISAMPVAVILFLNIASPGYVEALYTTFMGRVVMTVALAGIAYAGYLAMKLTKVEV